MSEYQESVALAQWLDYNRVFYFHVPNESPAGKGWRAKLKRAGVKSGVHDYIILTPPPADPSARVVTIELKYGKNKATANQLAFGERIETEARGRSFVAVGAGEAIKILEDLGYGS